MFITHSFFALLIFIYLFTWWWWCWGLNIGLCCMASKHTLSCIQPFLYILNFEIGPHSFTPAGPKLWCFCLRFPSSWDHRSVLCLVLEKLLCCFTAASRMFFPLPTAHGRIRGNRQLFITSRIVCLGHTYLDTEHLQGTTQWRWSFEWFWSL